MKMAWSQKNETQKDSLLIVDRLHLWLALCCLLLMVSCAEKVIQPPENLLSEAEMANILYDLTLLKATSSTNNTVLAENGVETMPYIYEKYGIDSVRLSQSDLYYASVPARYEHIYENVQQRLEAKAKAIEEKRKQKIDSTKKANESRKDSLGPKPKLRKTP